MQKFWVGTVSKEHVEKGKMGGFIQVCHGKGTPLRKMNKSDIFIYYSSNVKFGEKTLYQCFTALSVVGSKPPYQVKMIPDFMPYRRNVRYLNTKDAPIKPLIQHLSFIRDKNKWGLPFRFGILEINRDDFYCIAKAMELSDEKINELLI